MQRTVRWSLIKVLFYNAHSLLCVERERERERRTNERAILQTIGTVGVVVVAAVGAAAAAITLALTASDKVNITLPILEKPHYSAATAITTVAVAVLPHECRMHRC